MNLVVLAALWTGWCAIHSILIDTAIIRIAQSRLPQLFRYYRLSYNSLSLVTFVLLADYTSRTHGEVVFSWQGWCGISVRFLLLAISLLLFWSGAKHYDMRYFLGIYQLRVGEAPVLLSNTNDFSATGVFGLIRHPWYLGSLLGLWTVRSEYPRPIFVATVVLSIYLVVGTLLEERKIIQEYGGSYRRYQKQVSMLFPWKWLKVLIKRALARLR